MFEMAPRYLPALALAALAILGRAHPLTEGTSNITARDPVPADEVIAVILWFSGPDCNFDASESTLYYNVGTLGNEVFNPDQCNTGLPPYTNANNNGEPETLPFALASLSVSSTPQTCNPDVDDGQELGSIRLYPKCQPQINDPTNDTSFYCPGTCDTVGWSNSADGYNTCVNVPEFAGGEGPFAYRIEQTVAFCREA